MQEIINGLHTAVSQVVRGQLNQRAMADSENINLVRQLATQEGFAHRARMAELTAVTPRNVKGCTLLLNEQQAPVISLTP